MGELFSVESNRSISLFTRFFTFEWVPGCLLLYPEGPFEQLAAGSWAWFIT